jgi:hypothetical protein
MRRHCAAAGREATAMRKRFTLAWIGSDGRLRLDMRCNTRHDDTREPSKVLPRVCVSQSHQDTL